MDRPVGWVVVVGAADITAGRAAVARAVRRRERRRLATVAVCILVLLAGFATSISRVGSKDLDTGTSTEGIPKLIPTNLPDGLRVKRLASSPDRLSDPRLDDVHVSVFAKPGAIAPNDSFVVMKATLPPRQGYGSSPPVTVAADPARIETDDDGSRMSGRNDGAHGLIATSSRDLSDAQLTEVTRSVRFLPDGPSTVRRCP